MKKTAIFIFLLSIAGTISAQTQFQKVIGTTSNDRSYHLTASPDGGLIATGYTQSVTGKGDEAFLLKMSSFGEIEWAKTYGGNANETTWDVITTQNNNIVAVGYSTSISSASVATITRTDTSGTVLWSKAFYTTGTPTSFYRVIETSNGHLVAGGLATIGGSDAMLMACISSQGNLIWSRLVKSPLSDEIMGIAETPQGDLLFAGLTNETGNSDFAVVKTNSNGQVLWKKRYGGTGSERLNSVVVVNNEYYFLGWGTGQGIGGNDVVVFKTDTLGNPLWANSYGTLQAERAFNMMYNPEQNAIIVAGYTDFSDSVTNNRNTFLMSVSPSGAMNWARSYGSTGTDGHWPTGLAMNNDKGYYALASTNTFGPGNYSLYLIKTDDAGNTDCYQKSPFFTQQTASIGTIANWGTDSIISLISTNTSFTGTVMNPTRITQCCKLYADAGSDAFLCHSDTISIGMHAIPGYSVVWYLNGVQFSNQPGLMITHGGAGLYDLYVSAAYSGCNPSTDTVIITQDTTPIPGILANGNMLSSTAASGNQWYFQYQPIAGANQQTYHAVVSGVYHVAVLTPDSCLAMSDSIYHTAIGMESLNRQEAVRIHPNPSNGNIALHSSVSLNGSMLLLLDINGRVVHRQRLDNDRINSIDFGAIPAGVYQVMINMPGNIRLNSKLIITP